MNKKCLLLGVYDYTVVLTYIGLCISIMGISQALCGQTRYALICLMIAGVCDMFDGAIARTKVRSSEQICFGIQIDSLCDLVCFGILPMIIVYETTQKSVIALEMVSLYVICALIRLAYFNVQEQQRCSDTDEKRTSYLGLPVTSSALIFPLVMIIRHFLHLRSGMLPTSAAMATGACFIMPFKVKKPRLAGKIVMITLGVLELVFILVTGL